MLKIALLFALEEVKRSDVERTSALEYEIDSLKKEIEQLKTAKAATRGPTFARVLNGRAEDSKKQRTLLINLVTPVDRIRIFCKYACLIFQTKSSGLVLITTYRVTKEFLLAKTVHLQSRQILTRNELY